MPFSIELMPSDESTVERERLAQITIGDFVEYVAVAPLGDADVAELPRQWRSELARLLSSSEAVALRTRPEEAWILYREEQQVFVQNHLILPGWDGSLSESGRIVSVPGRKTISTDGEIISEWRTTAGAIRAFLERFDGNA